MTRQAPEGNDNADWGRTVKTATCDQWSPERSSSDVDEPWWYDARVREPIHPGEGFGTIMPETPVEIKSALWRIDANGGDRRGRWLLRERSHRKLLEENGEYALAVVNPDEGGIVALALRPAWWVDALVTTWSPCSARQSRRRVAQIPWGQAFADSRQDDISIIDIANDGGVPAWRSRLAPTETSAPRSTPGSKPRSVRIRLDSCLPVASRDVTSARVSPRSSHSRWRVSVESSL